jgi:hypothetical protein
MRPLSLLATLFAIAVFSGEAAAAKSSFTTSSTIVYNNVTYQYSGTSTCTDGTAALRYQRKWWCPLTSTTTTTTTPTTTTTTTTTTPTTTTTTTAPAPASYNAQLSWAIPTVRVDGTPLLLSDLSGYEVYYTNDTGSISVVVPVAGGSATGTTVPSLASGNYYFSISAIDSSGLKSEMSAVVAVSFP